MMTSSDETLRAHELLLQEGWERRSIVGPEQADEMRFLHEQVGREVHFEALVPSDLGEGCGSCVSTVCGSYLMLYTRKAKDRGE